MAKRATDGKDRYVQKYSYFGSFRSSVSNVGPNAAMLTQNGKLTDIGDAYLGRAAEGNVPKGAASRVLSSPSSLSVSLLALCGGIAGVVAGGVLV